jgi:Ca-activated chloride channel homolog
VVFPALSRLRPEGLTVRRAARRLLTLAFATHLVCLAAFVAARDLRREPGQPSSPRQQQSRPQHEAPVPPQQEPTPAQTPVTTQTPPPSAPPPSTEPPTQQRATRPPAHGEESDEVERISTDLTNLLLTAIDKQRRFVTTLQAEDLRVLEDGVEQEVVAFERETNAALSIAVLIDASASQERVIVEEQRAARDFVRSVLRPGRDTAAVVSFTGITRVELAPTSDPTLFEEAVSRVRVTHTPDSPECNDPNVPEEVMRRCTTAVWDSISITTEKVLALTPEPTRRAIILLSDGDDTSSRLRIFQAVEHAVRHNVVIYSIGIRDKSFKSGELRRDYLKRISEETGGRAFFPKRPEELAAAFAQIESELRAQYLISYRPSNRARDGAFRQVEIEIANPRLRKQNLRLLYRRGYYARTTTERAGDAP